MQWSGDRGDIDDARGRSGLRSGVPLGIGGVVVLLLLSWATGTDFLSMVGSQSSSEPVGTTGTVASSPAEEKAVDFAGSVMKDVQDHWIRQLPGRYQRTKMTLFRDAIESACGSAQSATGPFYCPGDQHVYLDLGFFDELRQRFGAPGDFAQAYVIAHEVGHHVQHVLGTDERVREAQRSQGGAANAWSVAMELQADCYAGVWGHTAAQPGRAKNGQVELDPGDVEEGLNAAAAIGDDRLQHMATGRVAPERFTHGSSAQRVEWFRRGLTSGSPESCDTFSRGTR